MKAKTVPGRVPIVLMLAILVGVLAYPVFAVTMEERIASALGSQDVRAITVKLGMIPNGTPGRDKVVAHLAKVEKRKAAEEKKRKWAELAKTEDLRREYAEKLREKFLDDGMDIKVSVSGKFGSELYLRYVLFNDVWTHKFQKGGLVDEIGGKGFRILDFNNGNDYHVAKEYW